MNNKQALKHLAHMATNCLEGVQKDNIVAHKQIEALNIGIQALQEKLERDKGCSYCDIAKNSPIVYLEYLNQFGFLGGNTQADEVTRKSISHCPMCGRKLVE